MSLRCVDINHSGYTEDREIDLTVTIPVRATSPSETKALVWRIKAMIAPEMRYATTINLIASGLVKLSKLQRTTSLYRGIGKGRGLPKM